MNKIETISILSVLKGAYPNFYKDLNKKDAETIINLWTEMFFDDDFNLVKASVKAHISSDTKGFPPVIGQIKDKLIKLTAPKEITEQEAWNLISISIRNSAYHATEEFEKLPETLKMLVGSPTQLKEWGQMPVEQVQTIVASNLMRSYKAKVASNKEVQALPSDIKSLIGNTIEKLSIEGGNNG